MAQHWYSGSWHPYHRRSTSSAGKAFWLLKPRTSVALRPRYAGTAAHGPCTSVTATLRVSSDSRVMTEAARLNGKRYGFGAVGPASFDCSGYSQYVFRRFGRTLPPTAGQQYAATRHIAKTAAVSGDLIFFGSSGSSIYHIGSYTGGGHIWHASGGANKIQKARIWTPGYYVDRL